MSQMGTELIPHDVPDDKGIHITLMYSKSSQQILFVEAGKDFVDLVVGFLTLSIGCVIKLLSDSTCFTSPFVEFISIAATEQMSRTLLRLHFLFIFRLKTFLDYT